MQETKVVNLRNEAYEVYIGRGSIFGNPYKIDSHNDRQAVIAKYKEYFYKRVKTDYFFKFAVLKLKGKTLGCYCKPLACHGDIIVDYLGNAFAIRGERSLE